MLKLAGPGAALLAPSALAVVALGGRSSSFYLGYGNGEEASLSDTRAY